MLGRMKDGGRVLSSTENCDMVLVLVTLVGHMFGICIGVICIQESPQLLFECCKDHSAALAAVHTWRAKW